MRGILTSNILTAFGIRFNPAYAGNMKKIGNAVRLFQVQPRVCGEYTRSKVSVLSPTGSTPRMRGIYEQLNLCIVSFGFNPAYAGNMESILHFHFLEQVQPRVCGEYTRSKVSVLSPTGSTPRMRGIYEQLNLCIVSFGFNPAYAGNMESILHFHFLEQVQPRVCGEYY